MNVGRLEHFYQLYPAGPIYVTLWLVNFFFALSHNCLNLVLKDNWTECEKVAQPYFIFFLFFWEMMFLLSCWPNPGSARKLRNIESCDGEILKWKMEMPSYFRCYTNNKSKKHNRRSIQFLAFCWNIYIIFHMIENISQMIRR